MTLTPVMVGLLVAIPSLSGSLLRIPFGAWVDTTGGRKPFLILLWMSLLGMVGLLLVVYWFYPARLTSSLYPLLLALGVLSGCGIATFSVGIGQVSYWFPQERQGSALGIYAGLGNLAPGLFSLLLPLVLSRWDLAGAYLSWTLFLLIGVLLYQWSGLNAYFFQLREKGSTIEAARTQAASLGQEIFPRRGPPKFGGRCSQLAHLVIGRNLLHDLWWFHRSNRLVSYLLESLFCLGCGRGRWAYSLVFDHRFSYPGTGRNYR